jgi:hypothetical protein
MCVSKGSCVLVLGLSVRAYLCAFYINHICDHLNFNSHYMGTSWKRRSIASSCFISWSRNEDDRCFASRNLSNLRFWNEGTLYSKLKFMFAIKEWNIGTRTSVSSRLKRAIPNISYFSVDRSDHTAPLRLSSIHPHFYFRVCINGSVDDKL